MRGHALDFLPLSYIFTNILPAKSSLEEWACIKCCLSISSEKLRKFLCSRSRLSVTKTYIVYLRWVTLLSRWDLRYKMLWDLTRRLYALKLLWLCHVVFNITTKVLYCANYFMYKNVWFFYCVFYDLRFNIIPLSSIFKY